MYGIEVKCNEVLGNSVRKEDEPLTATVGAWDKRRLNRVFDTLGFVYLDYPCLVQSGGKKRKNTSKPSVDALKQNRAKVTTKHQKRSFEERAAISEPRFPMTITPIEDTSTKPTPTIEPNVIPSELTEVMTLLFF